MDALRQILRCDLRRNCAAVKKREIKLRKVKAAKTQSMEDYSPKGVFTYLYGNNNLTFVMRHLSLVAICP
jgi:hypothetical protein